MAFKPPQPQQRYADTGRRQIRLLNRLVLASLVKLKESEALALGASYEIFVDRIPGASNAQIQGQTVDFDGVPYRVVRVTDPKAADPDMRGRYLRLLSVEA
jgi:hypothetical protein